MTTDESTNKKKALPMQGESVPAFSCVVYVRNLDGRVHARVANLEGFVCDGSSEREVLGKIVPAFRKHVGELLTSGQEVPWIDPPLPIDDGEQKRFLPVHL